MKTFGIGVASVVGLMIVGVTEWESFWNSTKTTSTRPTATVSIDNSVTSSAPAEASAHRRGDKFGAAENAKAIMRLKVEFLESGEAFLNGVAGYTARLQKQEVVDGKLHDEETMQIKCRHHPLSVYLFWETVDPGREVLFVDGKYDGKLVAHDGGWKSRLPAFTLDTEGSLAMSDARYPVTTAGLLGLLKTMVTVHKKDLASSNIATCERREGQKVDGRPCVGFVTTYKSADLSPVYRKSVTFIDEEWKIPVFSRHFEWPSSNTSNSSLRGEELDKSTIVESYLFTNIEFRDNFTDADFDRNNPEFHFH